MMADWTSTLRAAHLVGMKEAREIAANAPIAGAKYLEEIDARISELQKDTPPMSEPRETLARAKWQRSEPNYQFPNEEQKPWEEIAEVRRQYFLDEADMDIAALGAGGMVIMKNAVLEPLIKQTEHYNSQQDRGYYIEDRHKVEVRMGDLRALAENANALTGGDAYAPTTSENKG